MSSCFGNFYYKKVMSLKAKDLLNVGCVFVAGDIKRSEYQPANWNLFLFGSVNDFLKPLHAFLYGAVNISSAEGFWRWPKHSHFSSTSSNLKTGKKHYFFDWMGVLYEPKL